MARTDNLRRNSQQAFNTVAKARGSMKCGRSKRGAKREVCLAVAPVVGWKCGYNKINKLYACAAPGPKTAKRAGKARAKKRR